MNVQDPSTLLEALEHLGWQRKALDDGPRRYGFTPHDLLGAHRLAGGLLLAIYAPAARRACIVLAGAGCWMLGEGIEPDEFDTGLALMRSRATAWEAGLAAACEGASA